MPEYGISGVPESDEDPIQTAGRDLHKAMLAEAQRDMEDYRRKRNAENAAVTTSEELTQIRQRLDEQDAAAKERDLVDKKRHRHTMVVSCIAAIAAVLSLLGWLFVDVLGFFC